MFVVIQYALYCGLGPSKPQIVSQSRLPLTVELAEGGGGRTTIVGVFPTVEQALEACKGLEGGASPEILL